MTSSKSRSLVNVFLNCTDVFDKGMNFLTFPCIVSENGTHSGLLSLCIFPRAGMRAGWPLGPGAQGTVFGARHLTDSWHRKDGITAKLLLYKETCKETGVEVKFTWSHCFVASAVIKNWVPYTWSVFRHWTGLTTEFVGFHDSDSALKNSFIASSIIRCGEG